MITGVAAISTGYFGMEFGRTDFWSHHGILFLVLIAFFPRLTLIFSDVATGGIFWWLGWFFAPRILVAALATVTYWNQNPLLVGAAWVVALGGESSEKFAVVHQSRSRWAERRGYDSAKWVNADVSK